MKTIPPGTKAADPNSITIPIGNAPLLDLDAQFAAMLQAQFENGEYFQTLCGTLANLDFQRPKKPSNPKL